MTKARIHEGDSVIELSGGNEYMVMEEVDADIHLVSDAVLHDDAVPGEHYVEKSQVQHTTVSKHISHGKIQKVG